MLDYWKPLGGFIENTVRPLLSEFKWLLEEFDKKGIKINEENILQIVREIIGLQIISLLIELVKAVLVIGIICYTYARFISHHS